MEPNSVLVVDGNNAVNRSYHASSAQADESPHFALYGALNIILDAMRRHNTRRCVIAWDSGRTFRHDILPVYKQQREDKPLKLTYQLESAPYFFEVCGFQCLRMEGFEADDIMASLAYQHGQGVVILTADRDLLQVVGSGVAVDLVRRKQKNGIWTTSNELYDKAIQVQALMGIPPHQIKEYKALVGDTSDNVKGVYGIGPLTAVDLLLRYRTVDGIIENADDLRRSNGKLYAYVPRLKQEAERIKRMRDLFVLRADLDVPLSTDVVPPDSYVIQQTTRFEESIL